MNTNRLLSKQTVLATLFVVAVVIAACTAQPTALPTPTIRTIGIITLNKSAEPTIQLIKAALTDQGYIEGKTIAYLYDGVQPDPNSAAAAVKKLLDAKVDVIMPVGSSAATNVKTNTAGTSMPVVFTALPDPISLGLVENITNPSGNITGVATGVQYHQKRVDYALQVIPDAKRIIVPFNPGDKTSSGIFQSVKDAATKLNVEIVERDVRNNDDMTAFLNEIQPDGSIIFIIPDTIVQGHIPDLVKVTTERKIPLMAHNVSTLNAGALFAYGWDDGLVAKQTARMLIRVLNGAKPSELPVETAEYVLALNLKVADQIGFHFSDDTLRQATIIVRQ